MTSSTGQWESSDCTHAPSLIADLAAQYLLADQGYDGDAVVAQTEKPGVEAVIPPRSHRKETWDYNRALYKLRHPEETHSEPSSNDRVWRPDTLRIGPHSWLSARFAQW